MEPFFDAATPREAVDSALMQIFGEDVFLIGGRVRDTLLSKIRGTPLISKDSDYLVVGREFDDICESLVRAGARVDTVGASFAIIKATFPGQAQVDIAMPRREYSFGHGHKDFRVDFGPDVSIEEDMQRRDFTINAISCRLADGRVFALPDSLRDLRDGVIRTNNKNSFLEDPLRMLRLVQFASRLGFHPYSKTVRELQNHKHLLSTISSERIAEEMNKMLMKSVKPSVGMRMLLEFGMLDATIPELLESVGIEQNIYHSYDVWNHLLHALDYAAENGGDLIDRYAALLHDVGKPRTASPRADGVGNTFYGHEHVGSDMAKEILQRLHYSNDIVSVTSSLVDNHMYATLGSDQCALPDRALRRFIVRVGPENVRRQFALRHADIIGSGKKTMVTNDKNHDFESRVIDIMEMQPALTTNHLAVNGNDVISYLIDHGMEDRTFRGGRVVGKILHAMLDMVIDNPLCNQKDVLLAGIPAIVEEEYTLRDQQITQSQTMKSI